MIYILKVYRNIMKEVNYSEKFQQKKFNPLFFCFGRFYRLFSFQPLTNKKLFAVRFTVFVFIFDSDPHFSLES